MHSALRNAQDEDRGHRRFRGGVESDLYRYFANRDELILGVILRSTRRHFDDIRPRIDKAPTLADGLADFVALTVRRTGYDQNLRLVFAPEVAGASASIAGGSKALFTLVDEFLRPYFEAAHARGLLRPGVAPDTVAEWILRIILSLLSIDGPVPPRTETQTRELVLTYLVPAWLIPEETTEGFQIGPVI